MNTDTIPNPAKETPKETTKDTSVIPHGVYCYTFIGGPDEKGRLKTKPCPYYTHKNFNGVDVPWCQFLNCGGLSNSHEDQDIAKLEEHFGGEEKMNEALPLSLLWDQVKECGINDEEVEGHETHSNGYET